VVACIVDAAYRISRFLSGIGGCLDRVTDGNRCYRAVEERLTVSRVTGGSS
jgi:hypothetical protein